MEVRYERESSGLTTVQVAVPADVVDDCIQKSLKRLRRHVNVPGFRPGRVPPKMVESIVGTGPINDYAKDLLLERIYPEAMKELPNLVPLDEPEVEAADVQRGQACEVSIKVVTASVELPELSGRPVELVRCEVTAEEAREALDGEHRQNAEYSAADHEDARAGDFVEFTLRIVRGGFLTDDYNEDDPLRVHIGEGRLTPDIDPHLVGLSVGQSATFTMEYPDDYEKEELRGQAAEFTVTILAVQQQESLETFVQRTREVDTVDAAVDTLRQSMLDYERNQRRLEARERLVAVLVGEASFDIPRSVIQSEAMEEIEEFEESLGERGVNIDELGDELESAHKSIHLSVEQATKRRVLLQAVVQQAGLQLEREDLAREVTMMAWSNRVEPNLLVERLEEQGMLPEVARNARLRRAADWLFEQAEVAEVDPPAETEEAPAAEPAAAEAPAEAAPKRRRTRKPAAEVTEEPAAASEESEAAAEPAPKRRRSPRSKPAASEE